MCIKSIVLDDNEPNVTAPVIFAIDEKVGVVQFTPNAQQQILSILQEAENGSMSSTKLQKKCEEEYSIQRASFYTHIKNLCKSGFVSKSPENAPRGAKVDYLITGKCLDLQQDCTLKATDSI